MSKVSQNIFDYATSELSQDAFISLLVAWFNSEEKELQMISKGFIAFLYKQYFLSLKELNITILDINKMQSIKIIQQHYKIDVYFELKYDNETIPFIIEDKTWTEPHSEQLSRYVQKISHNKKFKKIIKIFFKTGHITEKDEAETNDAKYSILNTKLIYDFLNKYEIDNMIFNQYKEYLEKEFYIKLYNVDGSKKELKDWNYNDVHNGYVQYEIIKEIKETINQDVKIFKHDSNIRFTRNGKQWDTWWSFYSDGFSLFIKMKKIGKNYRIRLIKYSQSKKAKDSKYYNLLRFTTYIDNFITLNSSMNIIKTKKPRYKAREIEIAYLELNENISLENSVKEFVNFIEFFMQKEIDYKHSIDK